MPLRIRILGAGVAGLAAATLLHREGAEVVLVDQDFAPPTLGTSLGIFGPARRILERLGVLEEVRSASAEPAAGSLVSADGRVLAAVPAGGALLVPRTELVEILLRHLPDGVERQRRRVTDVRTEREASDLLVGADGVHSLTRLSGWGPRTAARRHGVTVLRGVTDAPPPEISETWGRGWLFGITPLAGGGTNWFAAIPEHRTGGRDGDLEHLRSMIGGHRQPIDAVLAAATAEHTLVHGIATVPALIPVRDRVVLIGDAAHAMAPNLGHGANTAMQDAGALADAISGSADVEGALRRHASRRFPPGKAWQAGSEAMLRLAMLRRGTGVRDALIAAIAPG